MNKSKRIFQVGDFDRTNVAPVTLDGQTVGSVIRRFGWYDLRVGPKAEPWAGGHNLIVAMKAFAVAYKIIGGAA